MVTVLLAVAVAAAVGVGIYWNGRTYRAIDQLLDCVLQQEEIKDMDAKEGAFFALASKIARIQEIMAKQVEVADEEKEQVKGLVSNMSHQLKTPLANLAVYTEILSGQRLDAVQAEEISRKIKRQIEKLDWIIGSLLKMVKLEQDAIAFEVHGIPLRQTILEAVDAVYERLEKKEIQLECPQAAQDCVLYHNRKWTVEVFVNILENAVKYTGFGGKVSIRIQPYELYTEVQFVDNGCGIPQDEILKIFRRFYRGRAAGQAEGCGIGLYLSNLILEKEKGYMTVKSVYGKGSCFSVFLRNYSENLECR